MEHPSTVNDHRRAPSSWLLPELRHVQNLPTVTMVHFHQCMLGQISVKPTTLLCVNAAHTATLISQVPNHCQCNHPDGYHKHGELMGRNEDGTWRTAKAKTYPSDMCRLLARALHHAVEQRWPHVIDHDEWHLDRDYIDFFIPLDPYYDFARSTDCMAHRHLLPTT